MGREKKAGKHQYMTSGELAKFTADVICKQVSKDIVIIDPCVGLSAIYKSFACELPTINTLSFSCVLGNSVLL